jgi:tRNA (guanosine-2'-O-)-methyltransferase
VKQLGSTDLKRLHREWRHRPAPRLALLLDNVATPFNVGSILRTAAAERVDHLWLAGSTASPVHERTRKTALGSERYLEWTAVDHAENGATSARAAGYRVVGIELADEAVPLYEADLSGDVCLALGHEDRGLTPACLTACDQVAFIPQLGRIGSLNVAVATAVAIYETRRRAWAGP